jgi:hypothetical protein
MIKAAAYEAAEKGKQILQRNLVKSLVVGNLPDAAQQQRVQLQRFVVVVVIAIIIISIIVIIVIITIITQLRTCPCHSRCPGSQKIFPHHP